MKFGFKVADLLMQKRKEDSEERSKSDTFMTSHAKELNNISLRTQACIMSLKANGFKVWRYKIENIICDSKIKDIYGILD